MRSIHPGSPGDGFFHEIHRNAISNTKSLIKNIVLGDLPGGPGVKNLPPKAGYVGSAPGRETKIPHVVGQPSPRAMVRELLCHN